MSFGKRVALGVLTVASSLVLVSCDSGVTEPVVSAGSGSPLLSRKKTGGTTPTPDTTTAPAPAPAPAPTPSPTGATPAFSDGFETGTRAASKNGYGWSMVQTSGGGDAVGVASGVARTGSYSMKFTYGGNADLCDDAFAEQRFTLGENLREVWFEYYVFFPAGGTAAGPRFNHRLPSCAAMNDPNGVDTNNKFFALWDLDYRNVNTMFLLEYRRRDSQSSYIYNMWGGRGTAYVMQHNGTEGVGQYNGFLTDANRGRWMQVRIHARLSDTKEASNGFVSVWFDGVRRINETGIPLMSTDPVGNFFRNGYLMGWSNSGFDQNTSMYVDDFQIFRSSPGW
jgi:hypothetical protein